jgi:iron(III) transport system substrate-binding protein
VSGEIFAAPYAAPAQLVPAAASGAPVAFGISEKGAWGAKYFGFIPRTAAHPACATLLADFMVTAEGQGIVMGIAGTVIPGVEGSLITNDLVRNQDLEATAPGPVAEYVEKWDSLFR